MRDTNGNSRRAIGSLMARDRKGGPISNGIAVVGCAEYVVPEPIKPKSTKSTNKKRKANKKRKNRNNRK